MPKGKMADSPSTWRLASKIAWAVADFCEGSSHPRRCVIRRARNAHAEILRGARHILKAKGKL